MGASGGPWALVLAAGEGTRLRTLTTDSQGRSIPKQFCALNGDESLLQLALLRAGRFARLERTTAVVAAQHDAWWRRDLGLIPEENVFVQPANRGTAVGVLFPLLRILDRDPHARVVLLPSDHFIAAEDVLARSVDRALRALSRTPERIVLLGIVPDEPDTGFGWIVPDRGGAGALPVERFVEKPPRSVAMRLMDEGGVWNSFILAAKGRTLLERFEQRMPEAVDLLRAALATVRDVCSGESDDLVRAYQVLDSWDFSRDLLEGFEDRLSVLPVPHCGWSDLGTPERVASCIATIPRARSPRRSKSESSVLRLDVAAAQQPALAVASR